MERMGGTGRRPSWARRILLGLCAVHAAVLSWSALMQPEAAGSFGFWTLVLLNALAATGLTTRSRAGWYAVVTFAFAAALRWTGSAVGDGAALVALLAIAVGVFCVTDPALRREHGIAS